MKIVLNLWSLIYSVVNNTELIQRLVVISHVQCFLHPKAFVDSGLSCSKMKRLLVWLWWGWLGKRIDNLNIYLRTMTRTRSNITFILRNLETTFGKLINQRYFILKRWPLQGWDLNQSRARQLIDRLIGVSVMVIVEGGKPGEELSNQGKNGREQWHYWGYMSTLLTQIKLAFVTSIYDRSWYCMRRHRWFKNDCYHQYS